MSSSGTTRGGQKPRVSGMAAIRNLGIMAHIDAGKTTTTERVLFLAGATSRAGNVDDGSTVTDWMPEEQERGISIVAAATTLAWLGHTLNLIDTPGHVDFTMEVERSLRVLDGAVAVFDAVAGVEPQSETVWRQADKYGVPRIALVNKCDRVAIDDHGDFAEKLIAAMRTRLGARAAAVQVPWFVDGKLVGVVDVVAGHALSWETGTGIAKKVKLNKLAEDVQAAASVTRDALIEALADTDETVLAAFVAGSEISPAVLLAAIRRATLAGALVPVLFGAAKHNLGVRELLDAVVAFLPAPSDLVIRGHAVTDDADILPTQSREASVDAPTAALAFKLESHGASQSNDHEQLTYLRVYSGVVRVGDTLLNPTKQTLEQVDRLVRMHANRREDISELPAGMIGAILATSNATPSISTGDTLCDPAAPIVLARIHIPEPVVGLVVVPETNDDHARMTVALERLAVQDPSFRIRVDAETGQTVIAGMGELHLEILLERLRREFGVNARAGRPMVAYRETVRQRGEADERYVRSEPGRYGHVRLVVEPSKRGSGNSITASASTAEIPREYVPAVTAGVTDAMERGIALGYPMTDVHVDVVGGSYHPVDSSASAFAVAGSMALVSAASKAGAVVLEPVMAVEVVTPDECVGDVLGDLHARRGKIAGIATRPGVQTVACYVPLASMFGYASDLRSKTRGRATYSMEFQLYAEVPSSIREELGRGRI